MLWEVEKHDRGGVYAGPQGDFIPYGALAEQAAGVAAQIAGPQKLLVALLCDNSPGSIAAYLAALSCGHAVMLLSGTMEAPLRERILEVYRPEVVISAVGTSVPAGYLLRGEPLPSLSVAFAVAPECGEIHPETALLLSTSGTTGSPKFVRLSYRNLQANAESIAEYLELSPEETAITSLPFSYSYGVSVVNSHLLRGGKLVCTDASLVTKDFWQLFKECGCTSLAGVPYSYHLLERLRFARMELPALRTMTQAGGVLAVDKVRLFADLMRQRGGRFFVMYGQTEASPRISYVPHQRLLDKLGSAGIAIPGGALAVVGEGEAGCAPFEEGEVVYSGPNVMLGYAESREDLAAGDQLGGVLHTGDIGYLDDEGYLFITGRSKRFLKIFGLRLNLDDVEGMLERELSLPVACLGRDELLHIVVETGSEADLAQAKRRTSELYHIHHGALQVHRTGALPRTSSGKKEYTILAQELKLDARS